MYIKEDSLLSADQTHVTFNTITRSQINHNFLILN